MSDSQQLPIIVTDLDGVVVNIMDEVLAEIYRTFGVALMHEDCTEYSVHASFFPRLAAHFREVESLNQYLIRNCWMNPALLARCKPYWDMWCALHAFKDLGGKIIGLTGRAPIPGVKTATLDWLSQWGFPKVEVMFTREAPDNKGKTEPEAKCSDVELVAESTDRKVWLIEDQPATAAEIHNYGIERVTVYMVERPWTKEEFGRRSVPKRYIIQDIEELVEAAGEE
jgi:hypothetical protein